MFGLIGSSVRALRRGGLPELRRRASVALRRRHYQLLLRIQRMRYDIEALEVPGRVIAGCMYRLRVRVTNRSRVVWNPTGGRTPPFTIVAVLDQAGSDATEGPHQMLPADFKPGESRVVEFLMEVPRRPGPHRVRIDLVRENCYWFSQIGTPPVEIPLEVVRHASSLMTKPIPTIDITMDITNKCPLKCIQCRKTYFETPDEQYDMNFELFKRIAADVFPHARSVMLSSAGEPLMTKNFLEAIELTRSHGVEEISFLSSGMHLNPHRAERVLDLGVNRVEFSLDGASAAVYNKIRVGSNFDKVVRNIEYLNTQKKKRGSTVPVMRFNWVLMKSNIHELPDFIDLAARLGVEEVQCQHMVAFVDTIRDEALVYSKELSNRCIEEAQQRARRLGVRFYHPPLFDVNGGGEAPAPPAVAPAAAAAAEPSDGRNWREEDGFSYERKTHPGISDGLQLCTDPWRKLYIDWQGMVYPCCMWKEEPLGDLRKNRFEEIWASERYQALREGLTTGKLGKSCSECSAITGGDINSEKSYFF